MQLVSIQSGSETIGLCDVRGGARRLQRPCNSFRFSRRPPRNLLIHPVLLPNQSRPVKFHRGPAYFSEGGGGAEFIQSHATTNSEFIGIASEVNRTRSLSAPLQLIPRATTLCLDRGPTRFTQFAPVATRRDPNLQYTHGAAQVRQ